jgi:MFS family permease
VVGLAYWAFIVSGKGAHREAAAAEAKRTASRSIPRIELVRIVGTLFFTTAIGGLVFQSTTFALPKVFDERLDELATSATAVGMYAFVVFAIASVAQLGVGYLVDQHSARTVFAAVAAGQALFFFAMVQLDGVAALIVATAFMLVVFGQIPINDVLVGRATLSELRARMFALRYIVTFSVMATSVPLISWIHSSWGFGVLFQVLTVAALFIRAGVLSMPSKSAVLRPT